MFAFLLSVALISLSGVMIPGPNFAVAVAKSYKSPFAGAKVALGHGLVEVPLILLIYFGLVNFFKDEVVQIALSFLGGGMLIFIGLSLFRRVSSADEGACDLPYGSVAAGAVTSAFNPMFFLWWATIGSMLVMKSLSFGIIGFSLFIPVHLSCDFLWLSFVSLLVYRTKSLWGEKLKAWLLMSSGVLLLGFGVWFLISGVRLILEA